MNLDVCCRWPSYSDLLELTDDELLSVEQTAVGLAEQTRIIRRDRSGGAKDGKSC